ncbi:MAG: bifunctional DNA-binding transcriptional regulator/O6-methylguanine-DNA methyltransferase Ada [Geminicoccaceae bacterium]|nr:bifunctional DNA-binding transcriptional regulator/O6-methylguanine-DNA methyltransferase Ada [Geminicoccaceae bacterium]
MSDPVSMRQGSPREAASPARARWNAVLARDAACDGEFVYAVVTTLVYCRPSCPSRRPAPGNVRFFDLDAEAEAAGFRPCRRCRPREMSSGQRRSEAVEAACRMIEEDEEPPALERLAAAAGMSPHHFHRLFKAQLGVTPKAYAMACREARLRERLADAPSVTEAVHEAGYATTGRFYSRAREVLGMPPSAWRAGGVDQTIHHACVPTWLGLCLVARTARGLCAVRFGEDEALLVADLARSFPRARLSAVPAEAAAWVARTIAAIERPESAFELPLDIQGTAFQKQVWDALRAVPAGRTASYAEIATAIGRPGATRAVASACGANPVAVLVPCHRIVRSDARSSGDPGGYRWGPERKKKLLEREKAVR